MSRVLRLSLLIAFIAAVSIAIVTGTGRGIRATAPVVATEPVATKTAAPLPASPAAVPAAEAPPPQPAQKASLKTASRPLSESVQPNPADLELPLIFERNAGQFAKDADFVSRGPGYAIALSGSKTQFALGGPEQEPSTVTMTLANQSCDTSGAGEEAYSGPVNYLLGNDSSKWIRGVQSYRRVRYESVYPGIDLLFHGTNKQLEYDFVVAPGVDPDAIAVRFDGMDELEVDGGGALVLRAGERELRHERPVAYQLDADGTRDLVEASYARMDDNRIRFDVGPYDASRELVIDPVLAFSTPVMPETRLSRIALDGAGNIWVTGTADAFFPFKATPGAFQEAWNRNQSFAGDAFVVKLNPTASDILFCTYLGGVAFESPMLLHVTASGEVIVGGRTDSFDFPVTENAFMRSVPLTFDGGAQPEPLAFVTRLTANGASLVYSTHLAFDSFEREIGDMTVDGQERPIIVGQSTPSQYRNMHPVTQDREPGTDGSAYLMRLKADGSGLDLSFRFGAGRFFSAHMRSTAVAVDSADNLYMAGITESLLPVKNAAQPTCAYNINGVDRCSEDAFLAKFTSAGETLFATYWGGSENETVKDIAVAPNGDVVMIGLTESTDFPLVNPLLATPHPLDGYLAFFSSTGAALRSTYYEHRAQTVRFNAAGQLFVGHSGGTTVYGDSSLTNVLWHHACGTGVLDDCLPLDATFDATGNFYFVGPYIFLPSQPSLLRTQNERINFSFDSFVAKIEMSGGGNQRKLVSIAPQGGPSAGGERVFVNSEVFHDLFDFTPARLFLGGVEAPLESGTFRTPPHAPGTVNAEVIDTNGVHYTLQDAYTFVSSPVTITGISPGHINFPRYGEVTISGTGFFPGVHVDLMDSTHFHYPLEGIRVLSSTTIVGITQGMKPGPHYVRIQVPGAATVSNTSVITVVDPPLVGKLEPLRGDVNGGTSGVFFAAGLSQGATVLFDGIPATDFVVTQNSSEFFGKVTFKTPRHMEPGWVDVTLKNPGSPDIVLPRAFRYVEDAPNTRAPVPLNGPPSGGTSVTLTGFDFRPDDLIMVDGIVVTQKTFIDEHTWLITTPPHHPGPAEIMMLSQNGGGQGGGYHSRFFYDGPYIESITPAEGSVDGGQEVTITGSGFDPAAVVKFGGQVAAKVPDSNPLRVITPPHAAGRVDIDITNPDGTKGVLAGRYLYQGAAPTVTGTSPNSGSTAGGTVVTITGTNFVSGATVKFDSTPATNVQFVSSSAITATTPPRQFAGGVTVAVTNPDHQTGNLSQGFTYRVAPIASTLTPSAGPATGGTTVVISGSSFDPGTQVSFGGTPAASFTYQSATQITVVTPAHAVGDVDLLFTNPDGLTSTKVNGFRFLPPAPTIAGFTPTSATPTTPVTITGTNFIFVSSVKFNNVSATFTVNSATQITANVPNAGTTGPITVTTQSGIATSASNFTVESVSPQVDSFSPTLGSTDTTVTILGLRFTNASQVAFGGAGAASFVVISATEINATAPANGLTGPICVTTPGPFTGCSSTDFVFPPRVSSFTPNGGSPGTTLTIQGVNFQGATAVTFEGGAAATPFTVSPDGTSITTTVPGDAVSGPITVTGPAGSGTSSMIFRLPPSITGFTPPRGGPGNSIAISGLNLTDTTAVAFNGLSASAFTVLSDTLVNATVPAGATNGPISVTTLGGTGVSSTAFEIAATPVISTFNPTKGTAGTIVTITGTNFSGATAVQFNGAPATFTLNSPTQITATVPSTATNGTIAVTNAEGVGASAALFYLPPVLSSFAPNGGAPGALITLHGNNFIGATAVSFNGSAAAFEVNAQNRITATVPAAATTGPITLTTPYGSVTTPFQFTVLQAGAPTLIATATGPTSVLVTWSGSGANTYEVSRISNKNGSFATNVIARLSGNSFVDSTALSGRTYLYSVRNVSTNKYSNNDYATTIMFTDDPVGSGVPIKAIHLSEIRSAVNAMRAAAALTPATWTDPSPSGVPLRASHITELRSRLLEALVGLGRHASFSDSTLARDMAVRGVHFQELRQAVK